MDASKAYDYLDLCLDKVKEDFGVTDHELFYWLETRRDFCFAILKVLEGMKAVEKLDQS